MSGYNAKDGTFELTQTKGEYWFRRKDVPKELLRESNGRKRSTWYLVIEVLKWQGLEIVRLGSGWVRVKATPGQVWAALSGQPAAPTAPGEGSER